MAGNFPVEDLLTAILIEMAIANTFKAEEEGKQLDLADLRADLRDALGTSASSSAIDID